MFYYKGFQLKERNYEEFLKFHKLAGERTMNGILLCSPVSKRVTDVLQRFLTILCSPFLWEVKSLEMMFDLYILF